MFDLKDVGSILTSAREAITGEKIKDPTELAKIDLQLKELDQALQQGQININEIEAKSSNWFVAGWRPFIGWVGGFALFYTFLLSPLIEWGCEIYGLKIIPPVLDTSMLFNLVLAMLGLGGMRTFEKVKKVQNLH